jgi:hypothetical protein
MMNEEFQRSGSMRTEHQSRLMITANLPGNAREKAAYRPS